MFFSVYDLGWTSLNHISYSDSVFGGGEIHFGSPEHFQTPRGWPVAVDELNCLNLCYSYHTDFWNPTDSIKVAAKKICYCRFSPSENTLNVQLPQLISEISHPVNYQWLDCDNNFALIPGETDSIFTALVDGSYALQVELDGCIDTSECVVISGIGIDELSSIMVRIHPNPTSGQITIDLDEVIEGIMIFNLFGELVQEEASATFSVSTLSNGVYVMSIQTSNGILRSRFIKE